MGYITYNKTSGKITAHTHNKPRLADPRKDILYIEDDTEYSSKYVDVINKVLKDIPENYSFNIKEEFVYLPKVRQDPAVMLASSIKLKRDKLLLKSDWTDTLSAKPRLGDTLYNQWQTYRQELRDIPQQQGFPENITWPIPPQ